MKMGNILLRAEMESEASVQIITPRRLPDDTSTPTPTCLCSSLPDRSVQPTVLSSIDQRFHINLILGSSLV